MKANIAKEHLE